MRSALKTSVTEALRRGGGLRALRFVRAKVLRRPRLVVLCYHRVAADAPLLGGGAVLPAAFRAQTDLWSRHFDVWPLGRVASWLRGEAGLRRDTVALTFDDGYLEHHETVAPILERHGLPATFFICSRALRRREGYWWDTLGLLLADGAHRVASVATIDGIPEELGRHLREYRQGPPAGRQAAGRRILEWMRNAREGARDEALDLLARGASTAGGASRPPGPRLMDEEQVVDLSRRGFEIGGHTRTHPVLARLDPDACREEIRGGVEDLSRLGLRISSFAYPFGDRGTFGDPAARIAAQEGITLAVTTEERAVSRRDDVLRVPRKVVSRHGLGRIAARLERLAWRS